MDDLIDGMVKVAVVIGCAYIAVQTIAAIVLVLLAVAAIGAALWLIAKGAKTLWQSLVQPEMRQTAAADPMAEMPIEPLTQRRAHFQIIDRWF